MLWMEAMTPAVGPSAGNSPSLELVRSGGNRQAKQPVFAIHNRMKAILSHLYGKFFEARNSSRLTGLVLELTRIASIEEVAFEARLARTKANNDF